MQVLYASSGDCIAFRQTTTDTYLYDARGRWIGWFPWGDDDVATKDGKYLGTVVGDRLLRRRSQPYRGYPGYPGYPGYAGYPGYMGRIGRVGRPSGFEDVPEALLKG